MTSASSHSRSSPNPAGRAGWHLAATGAGCQPAPSNHSLPSPVCGGGGVAHLDRLRIESLVTSDAQTGLAVDPGVKGANLCGEVQKATGQAHQVAGRAPVVYDSGDVAA